VEPAPVAASPPSITICSMTAPIIDANKPIVIGGQDPSGDRVQVVKKVAEVQDKRQKPVDPRYRQPKWCPTGLDKTQKRKLQRARQRMIKRMAATQETEPILPELVQEIKRREAELVAAARKAVKPTSQPTSRSDKLADQPGRPISKSARSEKSAELFERPTSRSDKLADLPGRPTSKSVRSEQLAELSERPTSRSDKSADLLERQTSEFSRSEAAEPISETDKIRLDLLALLANGPAKPTDMSDRPAALLLSDLKMTRPDEQPVEQINMLTPDQEV
jgi:hypothetical protein